MTPKEKLEAAIARLSKEGFPCTSPCDSFGICDNCTEALIYRIGAKSLAPLLLSMREALEFYAGKTKDAEWMGPELHTFDKFGGLDSEISGSYVANIALAQFDEFVGDENSQ